MPDALPQSTTEESLGIICIQNFSISHEGMGLAAEKVIFSRRALWDTTDERIVSRKGTGENHARDGFVYFISFILGLALLSLSHGIWTLVSNVCEITHSN
jgi:hypothetical protein